LKALQITHLLLLSFCQHLVLIPLLSVLGHSCCQRVFQGPFFTVAVGKYKGDGGRRRGREEIKIIRWWTLLIGRGKVFPKRACRWELLSKQSSQGMYHIWDINLPAELSTIYGRLIGQPKLSTIYGT
jgi:hypothetical protein